MKKVILPLVAFATLVVTSCASYSNSAPVMGIRSNNINTYVAADIDYQSAKPVEATIETQTLFGFIELVQNGNKTFSSSNRYRGLSKKEKQALYKAKETSGADIILEPEFVKESHSWFFGLYKTSKTKVKGWGVKMKGIKEDRNMNYPQ